MDYDRENDHIEITVLAENGNTSTVEFDFEVWWSLSGALVGDYLAAVDTLEIATDAYNALISSGNEEPVPIALYSAADMQGYMKRKRERDDQIAEAAAEVTSAQTAVNTAKQKIKYAIDMREFSEINDQSWLVLEVDGVKYAVYLRSDDTLTILEYQAGMTLEDID